MTIVCKTFLVLVGTFILCYERETKLNNLSNVLRKRAEHNSVEQENTADHSKNIYQADRWPTLLQQQEKSAKNQHVLLGHNDWIYHFLFNSFQELQYQPVQRKECMEPVKRYTVLANLKCLIASQVTNLGYRNVVGTLF